MIKVQVKQGAPNIPQNVRDIYAQKYMKYKERYTNSYNKYKKTEKGIAAIKRAAARQVQKNQGFYYCSCGKKVNFRRTKNHELTNYHNKWKDIKFPVPQLPEMILQD